MSECCRGLEAFSALICEVAGGEVTAVNSLLYLREEIRDLPEFPDFNDLDWRGKESARCGGAGTGAMEEHRTWSAFNERVDFVR
jgi:hypothetical protein